MKIIFDNIINSLQKYGGISVYWQELSKRMLNNDNDIDFYGYDNRNIFIDELKINQKRDTLLPVKIARYLYFRKKIPKFSIFHSSYYRVANQKDIFNIITIYDFTYEHYRAGLAKFLHSWQKSRAINKSSGIICISQNTKRDLLNFYPEIKEDKIKVIYLAASTSFKVLEEISGNLKKSFKELMGKKYILFVGDRSYYKNFYIAVETAKKIKNITLVIVGGNKLSTEEKLKLRKLDYLHYLGVPSKKLNILYNNAFCLLYPSSNEGFGIPILEAMSAGCPVVSVNISSVPQIAGDACLLVNKIDVGSFTKAIIKLENIDFRTNLIIKGLEQSKKFSWDKCFDETLEFYDVISKQECL